ncbi:MAG: DedA family protein [Planctomycetes bacterium]|nr:DedA family protein [Planctomycetota bacterium]
MSLESLEQLVRDYGYYALFIGTCLEGETIMILGGIAARQDILRLPWVILLGFLGSLTGDQTIFFVSRRWGKQILARFPRLHVRMEKVNRVLERHGTWYMITFRFFYGLRNPTPFVIGLSSVPAAKFIALNVLGAVLWAITLGLTGYLLGALAEQLLEDLEWVLLGVAAIGFLIWLVRRLLLRRARRRAQQPPQPPA